MATFKLGAIITDMRGSISGTTIRRTQNGHIMYNKQGTQIKSAFAAASKKNALANIFKAWGELDEVTKQVWCENALLYRIKNKFGDSKFLTGRQLFTKLNGQLLPTGTDSNPLTFDTFVETKKATLVNFSLKTDECVVSFPSSATKQQIMVSIYRVRRKGGVKPHAHFRRTAVLRTENIDSINISSEFSTQYPLAVEGQEYGFNIQFINSSGIVTGVQSFTATLQP